MRHMFPGQLRPENSKSMSIRSCDAIFSTWLLRSGQVQVKKGQISNFKNVKKKGIFQMQFELQNTMVPFILLCDVRNMLKYAFEL